ncbi:MAG: hypothetical protein HN922_01700, partial [Anaerolineae bacterium]|nr:hypothetical protein [Anaerolineae bacterium]
MIDTLLLRNFNYFSLNNEQKGSGGQKKQQERFTQDINDRIKKNKAQPTLDEKFLSCLDHLPDCSGVALGIDRL